MQASEIFTRAISMPLMRSETTWMRPAVASLTMSGMVKPWACIIASVSPSGLPASNSRGRRCWRDTGRSPNNLLRARSRPLAKMRIALPAAPQPRSLRLGIVDQPAELHLPILGLLLQIFPTSGYETIA